MAKEVSGRIVGYRIYTKRASNSDDSPLRVSGLVGAVARSAFGTGSKSERTAIWLETPDRRLVLRRKGGPTFDDRTLETYVENG